MPSLFDTVDRVVVITGAGVSEPSGLPVYRSPTFGETGAALAWMQDVDRWRANARELWVHWHDLARRAKDAEPNSAHLALARWERHLRARAGGEFTLITQNTDGLHARAGSENVIEAHGSILRARPADSLALFDYEPDPARATPPIAPDGSVLTRPDIVLFGERPRRMNEAQDAVERAELVLFAGTSGRIWPMAHFLDVANAQPGTRTMLLNRDPWDRDDFDIVVLDDVRSLDQLVPHERGLTHG